MEKTFKNKKIETFFTILVILLMISLPISELIGAFLKKKFFGQQEILVLGGILLSIFLVGYIIYNLFKKNFKLCLSDIFIILSTIFCIISIYFSKNLEKSLKGEYAYSETPLQTLAYFSLFLISSIIFSEKNRNLILYTFIYLGIFECFIAFLQNFGLWPVSSLFDAAAHTKKHLAFGLTEHCNYFATLAIIFTSIFSGLFIYSEKKDDLITYIILSIIGCFAALFTYTRIAMVGIFTIFFGFLLLEILFKIFKKNNHTTKTIFKKILIIFICFLLCFIIVEIFTGSIKKEVSISVSEINKLQNKETSGAFGTGRGTIWKVGLSSLKKYPLTGVGFDNYRYSFKIYPKNFNWSQNKGHNEYIHIFVTQGIPSGINYLIFTFWCCLFPLIKILKGENEFSKSNLTKIFLIAIFAYFVQSLFNSSVTNVAPYKWILMGLLLPRLEQKNLLNFKKK